jgi:hypothetical protein
VQAWSDQSSGRTSNSASELEPPEGDVLALLGRWEDGPATALTRDGLASRRPRRRAGKMTSHQQPTSQYDRNCRITCEGLTGMVQVKAREKGRDGG